MKQDKANFIVMEEWLDDFEKDMENDEELKEWIYVMIMYLWKGIEIGSSNRYIRQAFNNMRNNADRIKKKKDSLQSKGRPEELPADKVYELRSEGKKAKEIAEILSNEGYKDGNVTEQNVSNSKGWKRYNSEKKTVKEGEFNF